MSQPQRDLLPPDESREVPTTSKQRPPASKAPLVELLSRVSPRTWVRWAFLAVFILSCWQLWRYYQWALGAGPFVEHPEATAGLVPLGGFMSLGAWLRTGVFDPVMPASIVIILAAIALSLLLKRGFCGWVCPVGTTVAGFGWLGRKLSGGRPRQMPRWLDVTLRVPRYAVTGYLLFWILSMPAQAALQFQTLPYYATSDAKILYGILHPAWGYWLLAGFVVTTALVSGTSTWCRYMCPLGALYGGLSALSITTVRRDPRLCSSCGACDAACSTRIAVSASHRAIRGPECDGCQDCVRECTEGAVTSRVAGASFPWQIWPVLVVIVWMLAWALAVDTGHWQHGLPDETIAQYMRVMKLTHDF